MKKIILAAAMMSLVVSSCNGKQKENEKVQKEMAQAALIAIILIFISLVWMFDSIIKPLSDFFKGHGKVNRTDYENRLFVKIFTKDYFGIRVDE